MAHSALEVAEGILDCFLDCSLRCSTKCGPYMHHCACSMWALGSSMRSSWWQELQIFMFVVPAYPKGTARHVPCQTAKEIAKRDSSGES